MFLEKINNPDDVKKIEIEDLSILAGEMRSALLNKMSVCGGHFGSNFGMVEATIALHYVFNSPNDKIIFDVSHQSYSHKLLTGRKDAYLNVERFNEVSGYTNPEESEHDFFNIGHTSTSVSLACGLAKARDVQGKSENIIAVIGDGALSGGEALEGLNFAWELNSNLIIVVNDNGMSIAENHGGLYQNLKLLRESNGAAACNFFKALGYDYRYVEDGHNISDLITVFSSVKDINHPVVVHINTIKGKGYGLAEENKEDWHWRPPFYVESGNTRRILNGENYDTIVCDYLLEKMKADPKVVAMVAAVPATIGFTEEKRKEAGEQFVDVGICEEHAVAMAAGIARNGGKPIFATHSSFFQRTYDQISQELCINNCAATLLVRNASVWGMNDITHLGIFDIPLMSNIPNLVYLAPTNCEEYLAMLEWSIEQNKYPVAIRIPRNGVHHTNREVQKNYDVLNEYEITVQGRDVAIIALGDFYQLGEEIVEKLKQDNVFPTLINPRFITGVDSSLLEKLRDSHNLVITLEDGVLDGGFGQKIAGFYGSSEIRVENFGLKKEFVDRYIPQQILEENGLTVENISQAVLNFLFE